MDDSVRLKIEKIIELTKRGIEGEKENAKLLLEKLLLKYNVSLEEFSSEIKRERVFFYTQSESFELITQILGLIDDGDTTTCETIRSEKKIFFKLTDSQYIQAKELIDFHLDNYKAEKKILLDDFYYAYLSKHSLLLPSKSDEKPNCSELERLERSMRIKRNLSDKTFQKKIA